MPNCDFYATLKDHEAVVGWLFSDAACHVYEISSDYEQPLKRFDSPADVLHQFERCYSTGQPWHTVHLQLYVLGASPPFIPRRVELDPKACGGARFRYAADGWGLVQLYLKVPRGDRLENSHTNHNSLKRAQGWARIFKNHPSPDSWDFKRITAFSSRLNRAIRARAVAKIGGRVVLDGALKLWDQGISLAPYTPGENSVLVRIG